VGTPPGLKGGTTPPLSRDPLDCGSVGVPWEAVPAWVQHEGGWGPVRLRERGVGGYPSMGRRGDYPPPLLFKVKCKIVFNNTA